MNSFPDHRSLYRLPWSFSDNPIAWLEPTSACNIYCEGCYRANIKDAHKSLREIEDDIEVFERHRNFDGVSIAGGDPLIHPEIVSIVELVARKGYKPILNTNGVALTEELLVRLKKAGVVGFTFHIDSKQGRPGWKKDKTEKDLNELRLHFAEMLARVGGISCAFNATVYDDTLSQVPDIVEWARGHMDKVHVVVFIAFRQASEEFIEPLEFTVGDDHVSMKELVYSRPTGSKRLDISSRDITAVIRERFPDFSPCAYLNGTEKPDSLKWLLTGYLGTNEKVYGYVGPRFMELAQTYQHFRDGKYMAYAPPSTLRRGRSLAALTWPLDRGMRKILGNYLIHSLARPTRGFPRLHFQSVMIIQPIDVLEDGRFDMCDACPDITVHNGELVWSCRLEEHKRFGGFAKAVQKQVAGKQAATEEEVPREPVLTSDAE